MKIFLQLCLFLFICGDIYSQNYEDYIKMGDKYYDHQEFKDAKDNYNKAIELQPNYYEGYYKRGIVENELSDTTAAIEDLCRSISLKPDFGDGLWLRGSIYFNLKNYEGAKKDFLEYLKNKSTSPEALFNIGLCNLNLSNFPEAISYFTDAKESYKNRFDNNEYNLRDAERWGNLEQFRAMLKMQKEVLGTEIKCDYWIGICYYKNKQYQKAINSLDFLAKLDTTMVYSYNLFVEHLLSINYRGFAKKNLQLYTEAINDFTTLINWYKRLNSNSSFRSTDTHYLLFNSYLNRGLIYSEKKDYEYAINDFTEATLIFPTNGIAFLLQGQIYELQGEKQKALNAYDIVAQVDSSLDTVYFLRGKFFLEQYNYPSALTNFSFYLSKHPQSVNTLFNLGESYYLNNDFENSSKYFITVLNLEPNNKDAYNKGFVSLCKLKKFIDASELTNKQLQLDSNNIELNLNKLKCYYRVDNDIFAMEEIQSIIRRDSFNTTALKYLCFILLQKKDLKKAEKRFHELLVLDSLNWQVQLGLSLLYSEKNIKSKYETFFKNAIIFQPLLKGGMEGINQLEQGELIFSGKTRYLINKLFKKLKIKT